MLEFDSFMTEDASHVKDTPQKIDSNRRTLDSGQSFVSARGLPASITSASGGYFHFQK
jgi:hypothetical protein